MGVAPARIELRGPSAPSARLAEGIRIYSKNTADGRIRTGDPLNPIRPPDGPNHGKKPHKSLVGRTICRTCLLEMPESAGLKRPNNRPNRHKNRHKAGNRGQVKPRPVS